MVWFYTMNAHPQVKSPPDRAFKALRQFNTEDGRRLAGRKDRMAPFWDEWFPSENLTDRFARALSKRYAIDMKEFCEAFEFFARVRRSLRRSTVVDLCAGHGLTGILFALFERSVDRVLLVDRRRPDTHEVIMEAAQEVAPWVPRKVQFFTESIQEFVVPADAALIAIHACGARTDRCIELARRGRHPVALMPCCHSSSSYGRRPVAFDETLGPALAIDIDRTYHLENLGFEVSWSAIPRAVTPMNRVIIAKPQGEQP